MYKALYLRLFNAITDVIRILQTAQSEAEEIIISQKDADIVLLNPHDE